MSQGWGSLPPARPVLSTVLRVLLATTLTGARDIGPLGQRHSGWAVTAAVALASWLRLLPLSTNITTTTAAAITITNTITAT